MIKNKFPKITFIAVLFFKSKALINQLSVTFLFLVFETLLPKRNNFWCFGTWPGSYAHTIDNPRAVFESVKDNPNITKIVLIKRGQIAGAAAIEGTNVIFVSAESIRGAYYLAASKVILIGYSIAGLSSYSNLLSKRHNIVQLWHGIPLKRIGKLFHGEKFWDKETIRYAAAVCSSIPDQKIMAAAFSPLPIHKIWRSGLPRNELILKPEHELPQDYRDQIDTLRDLLNGRRFVLYAPTWRNNTSGVFEFSDSELRVLEDLLSEHNCALGIRAHANRRLNSLSPKKSSIFYVNDYPDVSVLLRLSDVLITDYSSIYIDFLLTGRPILHFTYDINSYINERGFLYDLDEALASRWFTSFDDLIDRLKGALEAQQSPSRRYLRASSLFHDHPHEPAKEVANKICEMVSI